MATGEGTLLVEAALDIADGSLDSSAFFESGEDLFVTIHDGGTLSLTGGGLHRAAYHAAAGGTLDLRGGGHDFTEASAVTTFDGETAGSVVVAGADVAVAGRYDVAETTVLEGYLRLREGAASQRLDLHGGTVEVAGSVEAGALAQDGGDLTGDGALTVAGDAAWITGVQSGSGETHVGGTLRIAGTSQRALTDRYLGASVIALDGGAVVTLEGEGAQLHADQQLDLPTGHARLLGEQGSVLATTTAVGEGATLEVLVDFATAPDATVIVERDGFLDLKGGGEHHGRFELAEGAALNLGGDTVIHDDGEITGAGDVGTYEEARVRVDGVLHAHELRTSGSLQVGIETVVDVLVNHGDLTIPDLATVQVGPNGGGRVLNADESATIDLDGRQALLDVTGGLVDIDDGVLSGSGRWDLLEHFQRKAVEADPHSDFAFWGGQLLMFRAMSAAVAGELERAVELFDAGHERYTGIGGHSGLATFQATFALLLAEAGRVDLGERYIVDAWDELHDRGERWNEVTIHIGDAVVAHAGGDAERAAEQLGLAVEVAERQGALALRDRARRVAADLGLPDAVA